MIRKSFNHNWKFGKGSGSALAAMFGGAEEAVSVTLPHDASILEPRVDDIMASGNAYFSEGNYHYTKQFCPDVHDRDKVFYLLFEGRNDGSVASKDIAESYCDEFSLYIPEHAS